MERELFETMLRSIKEIRQGMGSPASPFIEAISDVLGQIELQTRELTLASDHALSKEALPELGRIEQELKLLWQCTDAAYLSKEVTAMDLAQHGAPLAWLHAEVGEKLRYLRTVKTFIRADS